MRIALDGLPLSQPLTGIGHYTLELARHLVNDQSEDQISVLSPRAFVSTIDSPSLDRSDLQFVRALNPVIRLWWTFGLPRYLRNNRIELFHGTNFELPSQIDCATVLTIHDLSTLLYPQTHEKRNVVRANRRLPPTASAATMVISPTESVRQEIHERLEIPLDRIVAIPEAARDSFRPADLKQAQRTREQFGIGDEFLLYVGTVEPRKNLLTLVRAFEQTVRKGERQLQLVIVGKKGWMVDDLFAYVKRSNARDRIIFTGYLPDAELRSLYSSCTLFVYPSQYEGFGLPPLEAMACGAPVIASRIPSIAEVVGGGARLVNPDDVEELQGALLELLNDAALRESLSTLGKKRVGEFSWSRTAGEVRDVYREAVERYKRE